MLPRKSPGPELPAAGRVHQEGAPAPFPGTEPPLQPAPCEEAGARGWNQQIISQSALANL